MTYTLYSAEGTDGTAASAAALGANQVNTTGGGQCLYSSDMKQTGATGVKLVYANGNVVLARFLPGATNNTYQISVVHTVPQLVDTANAIQFGGVRTTSTALKLRIGTSGNLDVQDAANVTTTIATPAEFTLGGKYMFTFQLTGGSTTASSFTVKMYNANGTVLLKTVSSTTANLTTAPIAGYDIGVFLATNTTGIIVGFDDLQMNDGAGPELGPLAPPAAATIYPSAIVSNAGGFTVFGGSANIPDALADGSDSTGAVSPDSPVNAVLILEAAIPLASGTVTVPGRYSKRDNTTVGTLKIELLSSANAVVGAGQTYTLTTAAASYTYSLSTAENNALTTRTGLRWRITANA